MMSSSVLPAGTSPFLGTYLNRTEAEAVNERQNCSRMNCVHAYRCMATRMPKVLCMDTYLLLTKPEVEMAGYWSSSLALTETKSRSIKSKKEQGRYPAILTQQAKSVRDRLYGQKRELFLAGLTREMPPYNKKGVSEVLSLR